MEKNLLALRYLVYLHVTPHFKHWVLWNLSSKNNQRLMQGCSIGGCSQFNLQQSCQLCLLSWLWEWICRLISVAYILKRSNCSLIGNYSNKRWLKWGSYLYLMFFLWSYFWNCFTSTACSVKYLSLRLLLFLVPPLLKTISRKAFLLNDLTSRSSWSAA